MSLFLLPSGYWAADVRLDLNGLTTTFRVESVRRQWAMQMAIARAFQILSAIS
jgi:hypothetical protein